jgi:hypothetical protein
MKTEKNIFENAINLVDLESFLIKLSQGNASLFEDESCISTWPSLPAISVAKP